MWSSRRVPVLFLALLVLPAAACGATVQAPSSQDSGIAGLVTLGPVCPVEIEGDPACRDQPFQATIVIEDGGGDAVATLQSAGDGRFRVALAPGVYTLVPESPNPGAPPAASEQQVEVRAGAFTEVTVRYDSGIQ